MAGVLDNLRITILRSLLTDGTITRPEIVRQTGARTATVIQAVDELKSSGFLCEPIREGKKTGRKASPLQFSPTGHWTIGIDFRLHRTIGVLMDLTGSVRYHTETAAGDRSSAEACLKEIATVLQELRRCSECDWNNLLGIGFSDPGIVDSTTGISISAVNIPAWRNVSTVHWLSEQLGIQAGIWPECSVKTFMEYQQRFRQRPGSLFLMELGEGIGGGFIKEGRLFSGDTNQAMEVGHIVVDSEGPMCKCGNRGCLEALVGREGLRRKVQEAIKSGVQTNLQADDFSLSHFTECAHDDKVAQIIAGDVCHCIGRSLASVVTLLNPSTIVLSGELTGLGALLHDSVEMYLKLNCFPGMVKNLSIDFSTLKRADTALGAAMLMRNRALGVQE